MEFTSQLSEITEPRLCHRTLARTPSAEIEDQGTTNGFQDVRHDPRGRLSGAVPSTIDPGLHKFVNGAYSRAQNTVARRFLKERY
jgi:hypothetical protein